MQAVNECELFVVYSTFESVVHICNQLLVIVYRPGDIIMVATSLYSLSSGIWNNDDWNNVYSDDLRLRMMGAFLYQEETPP